MPSLFARFAYGLVLATLPLCARAAPEQCSTVYGRSCVPNSQLQRETVRWCSSFLSSERPQACRSQPTDAERNRYMQQARQARSRFSVSEDTIPPPYTSGKSHWTTLGFSH